MNKKRIAVGFVLSIIMAVSLIPSVSLAWSSGDWTMFRGDSGNSGRTGSSVARSSGEAEKKWSYNLDPQGVWSPVGSPIIVGDNIYIAANDELLCIDKDGTIEKSGTLNSKIGYTANIAYGDGKIFVPLENKRIQAFDKDSLDPLWISEEMPDGGYTASCSIIYHNGYIYTGNHDDNKDEIYFSIKTKDENASDPLNIQNFAWKHDSDPSSAVKGYYGAGGAVYGNAIIFAGEDGFLMSKDLVNGDEIDKYDLGASVRSSVTIDEDAAYVTTKGGEVYCVPLNGDGSFDKSNIKSCKTGKSESTSSPVIHGDKLYAISGSFNGGGVLDVIDKNTMTKLSSVDISGYSQSSPLITDAYSSPDNNNSVFLYVLLNDEKDDLMVIEDNDTLSKPKVSKLFSPGGTYSMNSIVADSDGTMYFVANSGTLFAVGSKKLADFEYAKEEDPKPAAGGEEKTKPKSKADTGKSEPAKSEVKSAGAGKSPNTGDTGDMQGLLLIMLISVASLAAVLIVRKKILK